MKRMDVLYDLLEGIHWFIPLVAVLFVTLVIFLTTRTSAFPITAFVSDNSTHTENLESRNKKKNN